MVRPETIIETGTILDGKYEIGKIIGSGGMGTVYEAKQVGLDRKVALKLLHSKYAKSSKIIKRFHQEARLAGTIEHDNICRVTDHGSAENGAPYLVMPLLSGRSLASWLADEEGLSQMQLIDIACQTLLALEAAHQEKIVHRDLKPDNIFVTKMGDRDDFVKLLDFGISKVLVEESASDLTSTGMVLGTAYYLAPEQARGAKKIDHRVDIYAMGVILYEALTGERPFEGETYNEVMFKIAGEPFKTPRSLNPSISPAVEQVIIKAMAIDPNDRFSTALEMCEALEKAAVSSLAPEASPITDTLADTSYTRARVARTRSGGAKAVGVALLILAIAGVAVALWVFSRPETKTPDGTRDRTDRPAPERTVEKALPDEPKPAEMREADSPTAPTESTGTAGKTPVEPKPESAEIKNADREKPQKKEAAPLRDPPQKPLKKKKPKDEKVIKGRFGTTFIFEE